MAPVSRRWSKAKGRCRWTGCFDCCERRSPPWATLTDRDCKPENMLIDPTGSLQITDFGLALAIRGMYSGATSQSGTPQFASPEQLLGERVDQRFDLYRLAGVAYYALLGRPPFPGRTVEQVLAKQTTNQF